MKRITITDAGSKILQESVNARLKWLEDLGERLNDMEREQLTAAIRLMIDKSRDA
jgi:DNA-binding MarR family transcriptional regulator